MGHEQVEPVYNIAPSTNLSRMPFIESCVHRCREPDDGRRLPEASAAIDLSVIPSRGEPKFD